MAESPPYAIASEITRDTLHVSLSDGRAIAVPLAWYPRLLHGSVAERADWRPIGKGAGIRWEALDEDVAVADLLAGHPSAETQGSLKKWLAGRLRPPAAGKRRARAATA